MAKVIRQNIERWKKAVLYWALFLGALNRICAIKIINIPKAPTGPKIFDELPISLQTTACIENVVH